MKKILTGFQQFITRGNVLDLAVGVIIGAAFNGFVQALVKDLLTPLIGAIVKVPNFSNLVFTLHGSKFAYGDLLNNLLSFLLVAFAVYFFVVLPMNTFTERLHSRQAPADPTTKKCPECLSTVPIEAVRCCNCTQRIA